VRSPLSPTLIAALVLIGTIQTADARADCSDPPILSVLTGESLTVSGLDSEGHPATYAWFITPPNDSEQQIPSSTEPTTTFVASTPGLWSVRLVVGYQHQASGGGLWSSETCITVRAATVVASVGLSDLQISTDEELHLDGHGSQWAAAVVPEFQWLVNGQPLASCNGGPPPSVPSDLNCTFPASWLAPGWHTAGLLLTDSSSGESSLDTGDFEVIEVIPLSVDFDWTPANPDPNQLVHFVASVTPQMSETDFTRVTWDLGDGNVLVHVTCPLFYGSCLEWPHTYAAEGWYDVTLTVETIDETASRSHQIEIGDPVPSPVASFTASPVSPLLLAPASLGFDGSCEGQCQWSWDFDDGSHSTAQHPTHAWNIPATYTISLTVTNQSGSDITSRSVTVRNCWTPTTPVQTGSCYGGEVFLTAPSGSAWSWNTGATGQTIAAVFAGSYWVNIENVSGCWGHGSSIVVLTNCGDSGGDTNLDGVTDSADLSALIPELTDGDGDTVVGAGGGDLTAPGGDVTGDYRLRVDDLLTVLLRLFE